MLKNLLFSLFRLTGLVLVLTLERVIGLPLLSTLLALVWLDHNKELVYKYPFLVILLSLFFSAVYDLIWPLSFLWLLGLSQLIGWGEGFVSDKKRRFLIAVLLGNLLLIWRLQFSLSYLTLVQLVVSYMISLIWMRVLKFGKEL